MRSSFARFVITAALFVGACKPNYPQCKDDDNCKDKGEVCQNGQCQECREDAQCTEKHGAGYVCTDGRCEVKPECRNDDECSAKGLVCRAAKCVAECSTNEDCPSGKKCDAQKCVGECSADVDCGPGGSCVDGACQGADRDTTKVSASCRPMNPTAGEIVSLPTVRFEFNEYDLTGSARSSLDQAAQCLKEAPGVQVVLEGHGDERGTQEYNLALGEKRANTVRGYLKNLGVQQARLRTRSKGENEPLCREADESCYSKNRRVEFLQSMGR
jgi:peptidoglycan-associated lipoprotein